MTTHPQQTPEVTIAMLRGGFDTALGMIAARLEALRAGQPLPPFEVPEESALPALCRIFGLSEVEAGLLCLAAGCELDDEFASAVAALNGSGLVDPALSARVFGMGIWDMLCPEAPLRRWRLVELSGSGPLRQRQIRADERIVQALLGVTYLDARLEGMLERVTLTRGAPPRGRASEAVQTIMRAWGGAERLPLVLFGGRDRLGKRAVAAEAALSFGMMLYRLRAGDIPADWTQRSALAVLVDRELALSAAAVIVEAGDGETAAAATLAELLSGPTILSAEDPPLTDREPRLRLDLDPPDAETRRAIWTQALGSRAVALGPALDRIAGQFALDPAAIRASAEFAADPAVESEVLAANLWQAARIQGRRALDGLADRIDSRAVWDDLVLPPDQAGLLRDLAGHLRDAWRVNRDWGWEKRSSRGLGAAALFAGPSGTGKTLAAEVLAGDLALDLYRIDLSQVVSKYIGETEKNLSRIFAAAEDGGAILLFDEADALFGKRSEVKDSHDRYANIEVSYLLQKMEAYRGLAILTTNQKSALDTAFLRRLRFVVTFPFPDAEAREAIWRRIFPAETPCEGLDWQALARLNVSGGAIRSIALNAAYLAVTGPEPVRMSHIRRAARREYAKLEKSFTTAGKEAFR